MKRIILLFILALLSTAPENIAAVPSDDYCDDLEVGNNGRGYVQRVPRMMGLPLSMPSESDYAPWFVRVRLIQEEQLGYLNKCGMRLLPEKFKTRKWAKWS